MSENAKSRRRRSLILGLVAVAAAIGFAGALTGQLRKQERTRGRELRTLMELRRSALGGFLETIRSEVVLWSSEPAVEEIIGDLTAAWAQLGDDAEVLVRERYADDNPHPPERRFLLEDAGDGSTYSAVHAELHPRVRRFVEDHHYYDAYMVATDGDLVYSVNKEDDFGTNLLTGPYRDTGLGRVVRAALEAEHEDFVAFSDFERFEPSGGVPVAFIASPAFDEAGAVTGVLAFQVPTDRIGEILLFTEGMGRTGETYLVGEDGLMRSDSRFSDSSTILVQRVDTEPARRALAGESGVDVTEDYRGEAVLSAYGSMQFEGVTWAVLAEQDRSEVRSNALTRRRVLAITFLVLGTAGAVLSLVFMWLVGREERPAAWDAA